LSAKKQIYRAKTFTAIPAYKNENYRVAKHNAGILPPYELHVATEIELYHNLDEMSNFFETTKPYTVYIPYLKAGVLTGE
jgi:hypothetical protein